VLHHPRQLGQAQDAGVGEVADVGHPDEGQQVVLEERREGDVGDDHELVVTAVVREGRRAEGGRLQELGILIDRDRDGYLLQVFTENLMTYALGRRVADTRVSELVAALQFLGYAMRLVPSPGKGYHHTLVVLYDAKTINDAARIWWILHYWGIPDVRLLNGGWRGWLAAGGSVSRETPAVPPVGVKLRAHKKRLATKGQLLQSLKTHSLQIIDARSDAEYCGTAHTAKRNGAIPGAIHLEWKDVINPLTDRFKKPEQLARLFREAHIDLDRPAVTHCQSGGRAAVHPAARTRKQQKRKRRRCDGRPHVGERFRDHCYVSFLSSLRRAFSASLTSFSESLPDSTRRTMTG